MKKFLMLPIITAAALLMIPLDASAVSYSLPQTEYTTVTASDALKAEKVASLVNKVRRQNGLPEMKIFPLLTKAAAVRAEELSRSFSHTRPDNQPFYSIVNEYGIPWGGVAENAAYGQPTPESAVNSWMNSDNHRKNLLNPNFNYIGVGAYEVNGVYYWDQIFIQAREEMAGAAFPPRNFGDANLDGIIDAVDATLVLTDYARVSVGKTTTLNEAQRGNADMNLNGIIDAVDASAILTYYAKSSVG